MRVLIVGSGAREHALAWKLQSEEVAAEVVCAPGNSGLARRVRCLPLDLSDPRAALDLARAERIDLTIIGPELPLAAGVADVFAAAGRRLFGPSRAAARLETSKAFAKDFMRRHAVPTARYVVCDSAEAARTIIRSHELGDRVVVKADGLAAGKGVVVADDAEQAESAVADAMELRRFGDAGTRVVLEERLEGAEVSFFALADGVRALRLATAQDHKRVFDGDEGPNTGGMGAFSPSPLVEADLAARIERDIVGPVLAGLTREGTPFRGLLYCGLMLTADGPRVIEFNVRFGDPEAQVVLPGIDEPLAPLLWAAADGALTATRCATVADAHVGVVLAAHGYPDHPRSAQVITGLARLERECPDVLAFFAGVTSRGEDLVTSGGRVMTIVGRGASVEAAAARAYEGVARVHFAGMHFRKDIGAKRQHEDHEEDEGRTRKAT
ncbi:MAG: phosphoribosylamine--glycine ligase [Acidobacteria bacterium]|nr:phosphoribosylamine--glycine ligase [Acidobacteriota bacterium]